MCVQVPFLERADSGGEAKLRHIQSIQDDLLSMVKQMLLRVYHNEERDDEVWIAAFDCLMFFITCDGRVDRAKLVALDPRFMPMFLSKLERLGDEVGV